MKRIIAVFIVAAVASCGDTCPAGGGCYCHGPDNAEDVKACAAVGMTPFCCTDNGGHEVDCGQPAECVPKPGIDLPGASGANWCCPTPSGGADVR